MTIAKYVLSMKTEVNLADHYRRDLIMVLSKLSGYISDTSNDTKSFKLMTRQDIIAFLDGFRKSDPLDPLHKWILVSSNPKHNSCQDHTISGTFPLLIEAIHFLLRRAPVHLNLPIMILPLMVNATFLLLLGQCILQDMYHKP
jgi:hypothetical protein